MKSIYFYLLIVSVFLTLNCSLQKQYIREDGILLKNKAESKELKFDRYRFNDFKIIGDSIKINVSFSGGCRDHIFKLIAEEYFDDSKFPQVKLRLSHNSNMDPCEAYLTEEYLFNLFPLK